MTQATATKPAENQTCTTCPNFNDFQEPNGRGWCELINRQARTFHIKTHDCVLNTSPEFTEAFPTEAFPTEVIELDRDGYPMGEQTVENAYFNPNFVTYPNEPF